MGHNILITGAAGYIGGSILANFISQTSGPIKEASISAAVRSEEQAQSLSKLGANVIQVDLNDETAVKEAVLNNEIDVIVHTASSYGLKLVSNLIKALGQRRQVSRQQVYFIQTHILVVEQAKAHGVTSFIVAVPMVYGRGAGEWRKLSVNIPANIRASIANKTVYKFDKDARSMTANISDLSTFYALLVTKILFNEPIPSGEKGYYFTFSHRAPWWAVMDRLASSLHARGLVESPEVKTWPSDDMAAEKLGFPKKFIRAMGTSSGDLIAVNPYRLGWQPKWDSEEKFLESMDDEVKDVLELDTVKASIFNSLLTEENK